MSGRRVGTISPHSNTNGTTRPLRFHASMRSPRKPRSQNDWTYFVVPDAAASEFAKEAADIWAKTKVDAFHGKDCSLTG